LKIEKIRKLFNIKTMKTILKFLILIILFSLLIGISKNFYSDEPLIGILCGAITIALFIYTLYYYKKKAKKMD
jgi:hypothetical protein